MNKPLIKRYTIFFIIVTLIASLIPMITFQLYIFFDENNFMVSSILLAYLGILVLFILAFTYMIKFLLKAKSMFNIVSMALVFTIFLVLWKIIDSVYAGFSMY
jgi:hypothetical protein